MTERFQKIIDRHEEKLKSDNKLFNILGFIKIAALMILFLTIYLLFASFFTGLIFFAITVLVLTVALWVYHYNLDNRIKYSNGIIQIAISQIKRINGGWTNFADNGQAFVDYLHPYANDLDIVGAKSLFQFLNTTHTWYGRKNFANDLLNPNYKPNKIKERQRAITELSKDINFTNDMQYFLSFIKASSSDERLVSELTNTSPLLKNKIKSIISFMPILTVVLLLMGLFFSQNFYVFALISAIVQGLVGRVGRYVSPSKYLGVMSRLPYKMGKFTFAINNVVKKDFESEILSNIKLQLSHACEAINALEKIETMISYRQNIVIYFILNTLFLWDYQCAIMLENWKDKYAKNLEKWLEAIGELESLICFSHLPNVCNNVCIPVIHEEGKIIKAKNLGHPLLSNSNRVNNDIDFDNNIFIISGSNMSGKTTFMRTIGTNLILASAGSYVCASYLNCTLFRPITSMRITDSLDEGISTFYAELKRIKKIIDKAKSSNEMLFLIDEIFRGTNSVDRLAGAETVLSKLNALLATGIITTHDLELCNLAKMHDRIRNHSFCEHYKEGNIHFDYLIKEGQSNTTNARFLMQMIGI